MGGERIEPSHANSSIENEKPTSPKTTHTIDKMLHKVNYHDNQSPVLSFDMQYFYKTISSDTTNTLNSHFSTRLTDSLLEEIPWSTKQHHHSVLQTKHYYRVDVEEKEYELESLLAKQDAISSLEEVDWNEKLSMPYNPWNKHKK